jgi:Glycosyltransferase family 87
VKRLAAMLAAAAVGVAAAPAGAQTPGSTTATAQHSAPAPTVADPNGLTSPARMDEPPPLHRLTGNQAAAIADRLPKVVAARRAHPGSYRDVYEKGASRWQVSYFAPGKARKEIAQILVDDASGAVVEQWTGFQVAWTMARGYPGAFGRKVNSPLVWIPLSLLFVVPFVDVRRPLRWRHLDLIAFSFFSVSIAFFNDANIGMSVPLAYPPLVYLLGRMLWIGLRRRRSRADAEPLRLLVPVSWLVVAIIFLTGFRVGLNVTNSNVIDVGYAGVIGADRISHGKQVYGGFPKDNEHGDTYGPVTYEAYIPFEQAFPWGGQWDDLPAAHGAAIAFDLLSLLLVFLLGRQVRGPTLGVALAYAWAAYPFTIFASNTNTNDTLVTVTLLLALLVAGRPVARGAAAALAGLTKLAPLAVAPVLATHGLQRGRRVAGLTRFAVGFAVVAAAALLPVLVHGSLHQLYDRTLGYQASRGSPFSLWGLYGWPSWPQHVVQALAVMLAVGLAFVPRRRDVVGLAACMAAILIALQLGVTHWFYLYIVWFFPLVMLAVLGRHPEPAMVTAREAAAARWPMPDAAPASSAPAHP